VDNVAAAFTVEYLTLPGLSAFDRRILTPVVAIMLRPCSSGGVDPLMCLAYCLQGLGGCTE
jgi:hypothetical protein